MTNKEFIDRLTLIGDLSDNQVRALTELLAEYFAETPNKVGFKKEKN